MNEIFEFRKELNIKKIIIAMAIILLIIGSSIILVPYISTKKKEKIESENPNKTFYSEDKSISLEFPKTYGFTQYQSSGDYLLELRTENNLNIFISEKDLVENKSLHDIASSDIKTYITEFQTSSNISEINEFDYGEKKAFTYSLHYLNSKTPYYLQVIWLETSSCYYIFDIEFPLEQLNDYSSIINDTINSFKTY